MEFLKSFIYADKAIPEIFDISCKICYGGIQACIRLIKTKQLLYTFYPNGEKFRRRSRECENIPPIRHCGCRTSFKMKSKFSGTVIRRADRLTWKNGREGKTGHTLSIGRRPKRRWTAWKYHNPPHQTNSLFNIITVTNYCIDYGNAAFIFFRDRCTRHSQDTVNERHMLHLIVSVGTSPAGEYREWIFDLPTQLPFLCYSSSTGRREECIIIGYYLYQSLYWGN